MRERQRALPVALLAVVVVGTVAATSLLIVNRKNAVPRSNVDLDQMLGQPAFIMAKIAAALLLGVAGWLLASRRPDVPLGCLALIGALADAFGVVGGEWAVYGRVGEHRVPLVGVGLWLGGWLFAIEPLVLVGFYLYFPRGRLPRPPAIWFAGSAFLLCLLGAVGSFFAPLQTDPHGPFAGVSSPLGSVTFGGLDAVLGIGLVLGSVVVVVRWVRSQGEDRREFRALAVVALIGFALPLLPVSTEYARIVYQLHTLLLVLVVLASVLRHRLYGIDVVLNRTLVFLILSALVAGVYGVLVGGVVLPSFPDLLRLRHRPAGRRRPAPAPRTGGRRPSGHPLAGSGRAVSRAGLGGAGLPGRLGGQHTRPAAGARPDDRADRRPAGCR